MDDKPIFRAKRSRLAASIDQAISAAKRKWFGFIIPRWNRRYDNQLASKTPTLADAPFLTHWKPQEECGLIADITADGIVDYVTVTKNSGLTLYEGAAGGRFLRLTEGVLRLLCC